MVKNVKLCWGNGTSMAIKQNGVFRAVVRLFDERHFLSELKAEI